MKPPFGRRAALAGLIAAALALSARDAAAEHIKLGLVRVANSGPTYIAIEKGYFAAEGLEAEPVFFEGGGVPIAVAAVSGDVDFGETATSGSLFSLGGQGAIKIIGGETREAKGFHNFALAASNRGWEAGLKSYQDLPGHSLAIPQIGSSAHYRLALLAQKFGFDIAKVQLKAVQSIPNVISAVKGGQVDGTINAATQLVPMEQAGEVHVIGWLSDEVRFQSAITFVATKTADERGDMVRRFQRAFRKGLAFYHDAFTGPGETRVDGPNAAEALAIISKYTGETVEKTRLAIAYAPANGGLDTMDIARQIAWYISVGLLKGPIDPDKVIDRRYVIDLPVQ
ncbi:MAG TPA: ABC transporter substrate-binding protein [Stellaceae bacterium]|nr:ABC transporter substrate-binding protein [Stellaceae bacterium]